MVLGQNTIAIVDFLESVKHDRACAVCYHAYLCKFLSPKERWCLLQTAWDCGCDYGGQITTSKQKKQDFSIACLHEIEELSAPLSDDSR